MSLKYKSSWYVYELIDPRDGAVFYVGKGKGSRIDQHEKDAAKADGVCSKKISKIKDLWAAGFSVQKRFNAFFWDEQAAYDHETDLIDEFGLENLTNVLPGGQKAWDQRRYERAVRSESNFVEQLLKSKDEKLFQLFRTWFAWGMDAGDKEVRLKIESSNLPNAELYAQITEVTYNKFLPSIYEGIKRSESTLRKFAERMKPYNVSIVYGGA